MRVLIVGGNGMLGHQLFLSLSQHHDVLVTIRGNLAEYQQYKIFNPENTRDGINVCDFKTIEKLIDELVPEIIINAAGVIKQREEANAHIPCIEVNALFPHKLSVLCKEKNIRLIHISTDCIFSGKKGNYREDDISDVHDLYGLTKFLGEVDDLHCLTLRTSIIGLELSNKKSLIEWFLAQSGKINGFKKAIYSGLTTMEIARLIEQILVNFKKLHGIYHVSSTPISKYDLLCMLSEKLDRKDIEIEPDYDYEIDRSLSSEKFKKDTGYVCPSWDDMLDELAEKIKSRERV